MTTPERLHSFPIKIEEFSCMSMVMETAKIVFSYSTTNVSMGFRTMSTSAPNIQDCKILHGHARFTVISPVCVRLEYNAHNQFIDAPSLFAANREFGFDGFSAKAKDENSTLTLDTGVMRIVYNPSGTPLCSENLNVFFEMDGKAKFWDPKAKNLRNLGGTIPSLDGQRGPTPIDDGLLSRDGWYLIDDSDTHLIVDDWVQPRPENAGQDWYLFIYGRDFSAALKSLTAVGGNVPLPRKYSLGSWYSRWHPYTSQEYRDLADEYDQHDFPLDVLVWDMDWHRMDAKNGQGWAKTLGWTGFSWNRELLPDAESLLAELNKRDIAVTLNIHPHDGIREHEDMYEDFMRELGKDPETDPPLPLDIGDKNYVDAYFRHAHEPHEDAGVAFWWVDWQQDLIMPEVPSVPGLKHLPWLNELYYRHSQRDNQRGMSFSRFAGWGDHRHPIHFSGDAVTGWEMLAFQVPFTAASANVGCFFWSHDMGGFMGEIDDEIYARWLQFGAFTAAMRLHGLGSDRRPWKWADWAEKSMRQSFRWRSRLMPYTYSAVARCCRESLPLIRATYIQHPDDEQAYCNPQQYYFGDHFLVAPIATPGKGPGKVGRQIVSIPEGTWYNWFTGERFEGRQERLVCADLYEMPLYVRGGVPIPMQPFTRRMGTTPIHQLIVRCFPGPDGAAETNKLYEDDGLSQDYQRGLCRETDLVYERCGERVKIKVNPPRGDYPGSVQSRSCRIELPCTESPCDATLNGQPIELSYDKDGATTIIEIPESPVEQGAEIVLTVRTLAPARSANQAFLRRAGGMLEWSTAPNSVDEAIAEASGNGNPDILRSLMSILGIGVAWKDCDPCGRNLEPALNLYVAPGILDDNRIRATSKTHSGSSEPTTLQDMELRSVGPFPVPLPKPPENPPHHVLLHLEATRNGNQLKWTVDLTTELGVSDSTVS